MIHRSLRRLLPLALCAAWVAAPPRGAAQTNAPPPAPPPAAAPAVKGQKPRALPVRAVEGAGVAKGWRRYEFGATPFVSVALPAKYEAESESLPMGGTVYASGHTFSGETDNGSYIAYFVEDLPLDASRMSEKYREGFYDGLWLGLVTGIKQELEKNGIYFKMEPGAARPAKVSGIDAREQDFTLGPLRGRARMVLSANRAFLVLLMENGETISDEGLAFLNSLEVRAAR